MMSETQHAKQVQVCLIEDHADLRSDLLRMLRASGYVVAEYANARDFLSADQSQFDGVIVSDMVMPGMSGLELQVELFAAGLKPPFIFISGESSDRQIIAAMKNHTVEFLLKPFSKVELLGAIERALAFVLEAKQADQLRIDLERRIKTLSPREREVFFLLARGFSNQELVTSLAISLATVKQYKSEVMRKVRVQSLSELIDLVQS